MTLCYSDDLWKQHAHEIHVLGSMMQVATSKLELQHIPTKSRSRWFESSTLFNINALVLLLVTFPVLLLTVS